MNISPLNSYVETLMPYVSGQYQGLETLVGG